MKNILIVESPTKSKTIESYMGKDFVVLSSKGHVTDLSTKGRFGLGIDIEHGFKPDYVISPDKIKLVNDLKKACKGNNVYLATDPDREGEAISYHLATLLDLDLEALNRIEFHEVTKPAILEAFNNPRKIDLNLVHSQETRRILDRIIGFRVSALLKSKIKSQSAGRVQSVALKLVCDLEKEILAFIPEKYYEAVATFNDFKLDLAKIDGSNKRITNRAILEELTKEKGPFKVLNITTKETKREPKPPFTTSTLQQEASNKLGFSASKTMMIAQSLYEGKELNGEHVGLITYMRTDSTHLSDLFVKEASSYISNHFGVNYLGKAREKSQKLAQNAHEAIRPTASYRNPEQVKNYLTADEYKIYKLIYNRAMSSLMTNALFSNTKVEFQFKNSIWEIKGKSLIFDGFLVCYGFDEDDLNKLIPNFKIGEEYIPLNMEIKDLETKPKPRYTEASLIKDMEEKGIGRPSTYATTMQTLTKRNYVEIVDKKLIPTKQGMLTTSKLEEFFPTIFNVSYTAQMEEDLDSIAKGLKEEISYLTSFYQNFEPIYNSAWTNMEKLEPEKTGEKCPVCGSDLVIRHGKYGQFVACSNYPTCKYIKQEEKEEDVDTNIICPNCHTGHLVLKVAKTGRNKGKKFYACNNYPKCKTIFNDKPTDKLCPNCNSMMLEKEDGTLYCLKNCDNSYTPVKCPNCETGHLVKKEIRRGKNKGSYFYACDNYPKCKTSFMDEPTNIKCELCSSLLVKQGDKLICSNPDCKNHHSE